MSVMLYKAGGGVPLPQHGGHFSITVVEESDVDAMMADGWHLTTSAALQADPAVEVSQDKPARRGRPRKAAD